MTIITNDELIINYTTAKGDKSNESESFGNSHVLPLFGIVSNIIISPKNEALKKIAVRIDSTHKEIEITSSEETLVRLVFK